MVHMAKLVLELVDVTKRYSNTTAVKNISFSVNQGEVAAFLGPNGAGKSTTMKIIAGFIVPNEGNIEVFEKPLNSNMLETQKRIGYMPENNPLYPHMTVFESIQSAAQLQGIPRKKIKEQMYYAISVTGLKDVVHRTISELSKGYKQRVGLAQVLVHDPELLLLDEPTEGLDPNQRMEIRNVITEIGKERTVLISTHVMQEVEAMCSRVMIINKGELVYDKSMRQTKSQMKKNKQTLEDLFREITLHKNDRKKTNKK